MRDLEAEIARLRSAVDDLQSRSATLDERNSSRSLSPLHFERGCERTSQVIEGVDQRSQATNEMSVLSWDTTKTSSGQSIYYGPTGLFSSPALAELRKSSTAGGSSNRKPTIHLDVARAALNDELFRRRLIDDFEVLANTHNRFVSSRTLNTLRTTSSVPCELHLLYAAVIASGAFLSLQPEVKDMCSLFVDSAQSIAMASCQQQSNLYVVQGLNILAWLELGCGNDTSGWIFTSMAGAMVVHQGLHIQESPSPADRNAESEHSSKKHERARTFWSFFWVNRLAAAVLGRATLLPKNQVKVPPLSAFGTPTSIEDACLDSLCQLWTLHDQHMEPILSFAFPTLDASKKDAVLRTARLALTQFYDSVDVRLRTSSSAVPSPFYFQISYHVSLILLNRPFLHSTPHPTFSSALRAMGVAASAITDLLQRFRAQHSTKDVPPFMIYHVLRAVTVLLLLATSSLSSTAASRPPRHRPNSWLSARLKLCLEFLEDAGQTWRERSECAVRAVQELAARWNVVWALPRRWCGVVVACGGGSSSADGCAEEG